MNSWKEGVKRESKQRISGVLDSTKFDREPSSGGGAFENSRGCLPARAAADGGGEFVEITFGVPGALDVIESLAQ